MKEKYILILLAIVGFLSCQNCDEPKTIICIPVYGQSLALGIDADRITNLDTLANYANGRIVTENMDHQFGYYNLNELKLFFQKSFHYQKHAYELTSYGMAQYLVNNTGEDTLICIFPGGSDGTIISHLGKGTKPYKKLLHDIKTAYQSATDKGWTFEIPAICWMQGETDVNSYPGTNYRELLLQFSKDINNDVKLVTKQQKDIEIICYQTNAITRAKQFNPLAYHCIETEVPQAQLELIRDDPTFHASGPVYAYDCVNEIIHIDGLGQKRHGILVALTALDIIKNQNNKRGLLPLKTECHDAEIVIVFQVPSPPLVIDTIQVAKVDCFGFSVITPDNRNIAKTISLSDDKIHIRCSEPAHKCRVRYAVNGEYMKSGRLHGPRGNLRDSQGDSLSIKILEKDYPVYNWCYQFDMPIE
jgi:hypothetical protein